jgi:hypothetical protein
VAPDGDDVGARKVKEKRNMVKDWGFSLIWNCVLIQFKAGRVPHCDSISG